MSRPQVVLLWSPEEFLAHETAQEMLAQLPEGTEVLELAAEGTEVPGLAEALQAPSLFSSERAVVVRDAERLSKSGVESARELLEAEGLGARVLLLAVSDRPPSRLTKAVEPFGKVHRLPAPKRRELAGWTAKRLRDAGVKADREAAVALSEAIGGDLRELAQGIDQLATRVGHGGAVTAEDVRRHFPGSAELPVWELFDAVAAGRGPDALRVLRQLLDQGDEPMAILFALVSQLRYLIRTRGILDRSGPASEDDLAGALGVSRGRAAVLKRQAGRLSWAWLTCAYRLCADADVELKGGEDGAALPSDIVLERLVLGASEAA